MNLTDQEREQRLSEVYQRNTGRVLDWNHLQLFTEKLQWYNLYYSHPDLSRIADKYQFIQYIEEKLGPGHTIPLIGAWKKSRRYSVGESSRNVCIEIELSKRRQVHQVDQEKE